MTAEYGPRQGVYEVDWPTGVTEADIASLAVYMLEGCTADEATAFLIVRQTEELREQYLGKARERLQKTPQRFKQVEDHLGSIFGQYASPAHTLIKAKEIEARGAEMPVLLNPDIDEYLEKSRSVNSPTTIEWIRQAFIEGALNKWQAEVNLLQLLKDKGPAGVVDNEADTSLRVLNPNSEIGKKMRASADLGRQRFHLLHEAARRFSS